MSCSFKHTLDKIANEKVIGPTPTFTVFHIVRAIELMSQGPAGRSRIAGDLKVGEGAVRTLLGRLKKEGIVSTSKGGNVLTKRGTGIWKQLRSVVQKVEIDENELTSTDYSCAVIVRECVRNLHTGMEQRDATVKAGGKTATTLVFEKGHLRIPSVSDDVAKDYPMATDQILRLLRPREKDVIVIVGADNKEQAEYAALASAWSLLDNN